MSLNSFSSESVNQCSYLCCGWVLQTASNFKWTK